MRSVPLLLMAALVLPVLIAGCTTPENGDDGNGDNGDNGDAATQVEMRNTQFVPDRVEIEVGKTVTWVNRDAVQHTVTPDDKEQWGSEGSGDDFADWLGRGDTYSYTFTEAGTYTYHCIPHPGMTGTIIVGGGNGGGNETDDGNNTT